MHILIKKKSLKSVKQASMLRNYGGKEQSETNATIESKFKNKNKVNEIER
jgi:hypothetical protein